MQDDVLFACATIHAHLLGLGRAYLLLKPKRLPKSGNAPVYLLSKRTSLPHVGLKTSKQNQTAACIGLPALEISQKVSNSSISHLISVPDA